jgi:hypothetical protein
VELIEPAFLRYKSPWLIALISNQLKPTRERKQLKYTTELVKPDARRRCPMISSCRLV